MNLEIRWLETYKILPETGVVRNTFRTYEFSIVKRFNYFYTMETDTTTRIQLHFDILRKWKTVVLVSFLCTVIVLGVFYLHPQNNDWFTDSNFSFGNLLQFILVDQFFFEIVTVALLAFWMVNYAKFIGLKYLPMKVMGVVGYYVRFLPICIFGYFLSVPFTVSLRFLYHRFILDRKSTRYFEEYFFWDIDLYMAYLLPVSFMVVLLLTILLFHSVQLHKEQTATMHSDDAIKVEVQTETGRTMLKSSEIVWVQRVGRKYELLTTDGATYFVNISLKALEQKLGPIFFMVNRSTLINIDEIKEYAFWEHEKYIVRMKNCNEFNATRERIKILKQLLQNGS